MIEAQPNDKARIIEILTYAFEQNASVDHIVKRDEARLVRIRKLMEYAYKVCCRFGKVVLSDDRNACALVQLQKKKFSLQSMLWDIQLILNVTGIENITKVLKRESLIGQQHPSGDFYYLWFIGTHPVHTGLGTGSELLNELIADADNLGATIYLETSTVTNIPWYKKFGFQVFHEIDIGYKLFFLKRLSHK